jgi:hypothetical protein
MTAPEFEHTLDGLLGCELLELNAHSVRAPPGGPKPLQLPTTTAGGPP